jgi:DNA polymerase-3 subunit alpha
MQSCLKLEEIIDFSVKNNCKYACLVDINTMFGTLEFYKLCKKNNLIPVIGVQIDGVAYIAKNNIGLKQLYKLSLLNSKDKDISNENKDQCCAIILNEQKNINNCFKTFNKSEIAVKENFCLIENDIEVLKAVTAIKTGKLLSEISNDFTNTNFLSEEEAKKLFSQQQLDNLNSLLSDINIEIDLSSKINFVKYDKNADSKVVIRELCELGLKKKILHITDEYIKRMNYELDVIDTMGFNDYFLVLYDYINYAKSSNIFIGPGRGSAAGSLVAYLLNITEVNPIEHNLIFERFLNISRKTMPDIDTDIEDDRREEVAQYLFNKYGYDNTSTIVTFQRMKAKMALSDVGRILNIDVKLIKNITKLYGIQHE